MDIDQVHRIANLYDACWEIVREGTGEGVSAATRARFVACWGLESAAQDNDTLMHWARNFLAHNARPEFERGET
jgi:hypothetical protein